MATLTVNESKKVGAINVGDAVVPKGASVMKMTHVPTNPYAANGDACDIAAKFPCGKVYGVMLPPLTSNGACIPVWDEANKKMKLYTAPGTESTGVDRTAATVVFYAIGA